MPETAFLQIRLAANDRKRIKRYGVRPNGVLDAVP
jgi:hypothetical protein